jgi:hypothetical protein
MPPPITQILGSRMHARHRPVFCLRIQASFCAAACAAVFATVAAAAPAGERLGVTVNQIALAELQHSLL